MTEALSELEEEDNAYDRQMIVSHWNQKKLSSTKVGIIGQGGLGFDFAVELARMGVSQIEMCDGDDVEMSNLSRQRFYPEHIGVNKAFSAIDILTKECTGKTSLIAYPYFFMRVFDEQPDAFSSVDMLICMVDNEAVKYEAAEFGKKHKIPVVYAGVATSMRLANVVVQDPDGPCYACMYPKANDGDINERNECKYPAVIYIHAAIIGIAVYATVARIMGWNTHWNEYILSLDSENQLFTHKKRPGCEICGGV